MNLIVIIKVECGNIAEEIKSTLVQLSNIVLRVNLIHLVAGSDFLLSYHVVSCVKGYTFYISNFIYILEHCIKSNPIDTWRRTAYLPVLYCWNVAIFFLLSSSRFIIKHNF